jgi:hypothetical protein
MTRRVFKNQMKKYAVNKTPEADVLRAVDEVLFACGIFHWRMSVGAVKIGKRFVRFGVPGLPDFIGVCPGGRFLGVECKAPKTGRLTQLQARFLDKVNELGGVGIVVDGVDGLLEQLKTRGVIK